MDAITANLVIELIEKMGLLRRDMKNKKEDEKYEARLARIELKLSALAQHVSADDPTLAKRIRMAWERPASSLAFRNAEHQKELKRSDEGSGEPGE
jgi:hypothetical protein